MHIRWEVAEGDVPMEFMKQALSHLDCAEKLNLLMCEGAWTSNYYRGQAVLWLTFHAVELFLKGFILKLDPTANVNGHSLAVLATKLETLAPGTKFEPPFGSEAVPPYPGLMKEAEKAEKKIHEMLRYPIDTEGKPWPGVRGFSALTFQGMLARTRADCENLYVRLFEDGDR
jgi:hypothetical protein